MGGSHESVRLIGIQMIQVGTGVGARTYKRNGKKKRMEGVMEWRMGWGQECGSVLFCFDFVERYWLAMGIVHIKFMWDHQPGQPMKY